LGICVEWIAGGVRLATRSDLGAWVRQFFRQRNRTRLSHAALETLAIVAYRQPVTGPEIQAIRGKDPTAALKGLLDKKLLRCLGRKRVVGSPVLYGTTKQFLVHFGLNTLEDLPSIEEFDQFVGALEEQGLLDLQVHEDEVDEAPGEPDASRAALVEGPAAQEPAEGEGRREDA
jgi:segregation and condensation protein B